MCIGPDCPRVKAVGADRAGVDRAPRQRDTQRTHPPVFAIKRFVRALGAEALAFVVWRFENPPRVDQECLSARAPGRSLLFTTKTSAISRIPALAAWMESPIPGATITSVESAREAISTSAWPTPTVSTRITSKLAPSRIRSACGAAQDRP